MADLEQPTKYLHDNPNPNTPTLAGVAINLAELSREEELDYSYLSHLFSGNKLPSPKYAARLADALGMSPAGLYVAIYDLQDRKQHS